MYTNKKNKNELAARHEPFEQTRMSLKNRLRWRIRSAQRALQVKAELESQVVEAHRPVYEIGAILVRPK